MDGLGDPMAEDFGPFGRPLFDDPKVKALTRVGAIDVGSNSVRLVVFDGAARSPAYFFNEKIMCGLGEGISDTGRLNPDGRERALAALRRFVLLSESMQVTPLVTVATAAVRTAEDGPEFCDEIEKETGLRIWVAKGEEEARMSAQGVLLGWPEADGLVCDIGGSSMELAEIRDGQIGRTRSSELGPLKLWSVKGGKKGRKAEIDRTMQKLRKKFDGNYTTIYLVGGSWRAIARLDMERREYPLKVLHEYRMSRKSVLQTVKWIGKNDVDELRAISGSSEARMRLVPIASEVLKSLVQTFKPGSFAVSSYGIREGLLYGELPDELKSRDPLIEACRHEERQHARIPGFGRTLFSFIQPIYKSAPRSKLRLVKAACLLHDVNWRAHPDYRAEVCFESVTRANLGGLDHPGRIFLGVALLHRYKNSRSGIRYEDLFEMIPAKELLRAEVLGKAMRFGAMFAAERPNQMGQLKWRPKKRVLQFTRHPENWALFGEVAEARFRSLADSLEAEIEVL